MYLHEDREMFKTIVEQVAEESGKNSIVIEKDYYVTMILRLLSEQRLQKTITEQKIESLERENARLKRAIDQKSVNFLKNL